MSLFPAFFDLSDLDGTNGFSISGVNTDEFGFSVAGVGDVNSDGIEDFIIGARYADAGTIENAGGSYVVFGSNLPFSRLIEVSSLDGSNGFLIEGIDAGDELGYSVGKLGDVNNDGVDDIVVGAYAADPNGVSASGESYVVFGSSTGFDSRLALSEIDGNNGFVLNGIDQNDTSGALVTGIGDINHDGIADFAIGAPQADPNSRSNTGESYIVYGSSNFSSALGLSALNGSNGFTVNGFDFGSYSGSAISGAGDINNDGVDDFIIGAYSATPDGRLQAGKTYVVFGNAAGFSASFELSDLDGSNGFTLNGIGGNTQQRSFGDFSGASVSDIGDVNGDNIDDIVIGAYRAIPNGLGSGESYVVFGSDAGFNANFELSDLDGSNGFVLYGTAVNDFSGYSVSGAGDLNSDGFNDILIGASRAKALDGSSSAGESYVVYGKSDGFSASLELSALDGINGFTIRTNEGGGLLGHSVSEIGDVNNDGINDIILGAPNAGRFSLGESHVIFGRSDDAMAGDDIIFGQPGDNIIDAGAGNDVVIAQSGADTLVGGSGSDRIYANGGNDILQGDDGDDTLHGGAGNDTLEGGNNNDILDGGAGLDTVNGGSGSDVLLGYADADTLNGGSGSDVLFGHQGNDLLHGDDDSDRLYGGSGMDFLYGDAGDDQLRGGEDDDSLFGGEGNDSLEGNSGNDALQGNAGDDFLYGGAGDDTVDGGTGDDAIFAQAGDDTAIGGAGNDVIYGGEGNDTLIGGGLGSTSLGQIDRLSGGAGRDTYVVASMYAADADRDFAIIRGFNKAEDTIQLSDDTHTLADISVGSGLYATSGTGIYSSSGDLLAVVESYAAGSLNLSESYFMTE